jgi:competence protein ComEC
MVFCILSYCFGIIATFYTGATYPLWVFVLSLCFSIVIFSLVIFTNRCRVFFIICAFVIGYSWSAYRYHNLLSWSLPTASISKTVLLEGQVISIPKKIQRMARFEFLISKFNHKPLQSTVILSWYNHYPNLQLGQKWRFYVRLKPPHSLHNPGGFNYEQWLVFHGIRASGYVLPKKTHQLLSVSSVALLKNTRQSTVNQLQSLSMDKPIKAMLVALSVGSRSLFEFTDWRVFQNTGTSHLFAISGLHVGLVATLIYWFFGRFARLFPSLLRYVPAQTIGAIASVVLLVFYCLLVGFSLSTQRAFIMIESLLLTSLLRNYMPPWQRLLFAFFVVLLIDPFAILMAGFWLSFFAVLWLSYLALNSEKNQNKWRLWFSVQAKMFLGLLPLTLLYFHQVPLTMIAANTIAIPWVSFIIVPGCLLSTLLSQISLTLGNISFLFIGKLLLPLFSLLHYLSSLSGLLWHHSIATPLVFICLLVAVFLVLAPKNTPGKCLAIIFVLPLFFTTSDKPVVGFFNFTLLDVGQGLSAIVNTASHTLVYDAGPRTLGFDAGASVVVPYLRYQQIHKVDTLVISHGDNDHSGGVASILSSLPVANLLSSVPKNWPKNFSRQISPCYAGQKWQWDGVKFSFLSPKAFSPYLKNNSSCVLKIVDALGHSVLLTGDIESPQEQWLIDHNAGRLAATVLVAPHHGSRTSSSPMFVSIVHPRYVLFPVGFYNRFHFPSLEVIQRYRKIKAKMYSTAASGAITIHFLPSGQIALTTAYKRYIL